MIGKLEELLHDFVYKEIWSSLTAKERVILLAISGNEEKVSTVCKKASVSSSTFSKYKEKLQARGLIRAEKYGYISLALPRFYEVARNYIL